MLASPFTPSGYVITEYFTPGTVPSEQSEYWVIPQTPADFNVALNGIGLPVITFKPADTFAVYNIFRLEEGLDAPLHIYQIHTNTLNMVEWTDTLANRGKKYSYYVVPVHPEVLVEGQPLQGPPTPTLSVEVPLLSPEPDTRHSAGDNDNKIPGSQETDEPDNNLQHDETALYRLQQEQRKKKIKLELLD